LSSSHRDDSLRIISSNRYNEVSFYRNTFITAYPEDLRFLPLRIHFEKSEVLITPALPQYLTAGRRILANILMLYFNRGKFLLIEFLTYRISISFLANVSGEIGSLANPGLTSIPHRWQVNPRKHFNALLQQRQVPTYRILP